MRSHPAPEVTWYKDGQPLTLSESIFVEMVPSTEVGVVRGILRFRAQSHFDNANYTLVVANNYGSDNRTVTAFFMDAPGRSHRHFSVVLARSDKLAHPFSSRLFVIGCRI